MTDLLSAIELAAAGEVSGAFAVGSDGWLEQDQVEELSGLRRIELPAGVTFATAQRLHRAGITPAPVSDLHYVVYPWVVDCNALRDAGWRPTVTNAEALQVLLAQRAGHHAVASAPGEEGRDDHGGRSHGRRHRDRGHRPPGAQAPS